MAFKIPYRIGIFTSLWTRRSMKQSNSIHSFIQSWLLVAVSLIPLEGRPISTPQVKLEVVSVRILSSKEAAAQSPDFLGPNVAVRLRLSNPTPDGAYFYTWERS